MCTTLMGGKLSVFVFVLLLILAFITNAQASCARWGHACWGGHGKRSGGGSSSSSSVGRGAENRPRVSWMDHSNVGPPDDGSSTFPDPSSSDSVLDGFRGFSVHSIPSLSSLSRSGLGRDKIIMEDNVRREEGGDDDNMAMEEIYDYNSQQNDVTIPKRVNDQDRHDYYDATSRGLNSWEDTKRGDMSTRKSPKNNLFLYKLI